MRLSLALCALVVSCAYWLWQGTGLLPASLPHARDELPPASVVPTAAPAPAAPQPVVLSTTVRRNETLEQIFRREGLSVAALAEMRRDPEVRRNLDHVNAGEQLTITHLDGVPQTISRELSLTERSVVRLGDAGYRLESETKPVVVIERHVRGTIDSSLFAAGDAAGLDDGIILQLAHIFGWDIDFALDLRQGDQFMVSYQRLYQYGRYVRDGDILAARFINNGREFRAVRYQAPDGTVHYYTPDGHSMEKQFLRAPLEFRRVSSRFSTGRYHPILNRIRAHKGVDYAAATGTQVYAAGDGRIRKRGPGGGYGNVIEIDHGAGITTVYGHLSRFARGQHVGSYVHQGETIGYVGMSGLATGPHLHYEYRVDGRAVDPQKVKLPDARPIDDALRADFYRQTTPLLAAFTADVGPPTRELPSRR